ncbi:MAG: biotin/lipoyl-containing protein [Bacillota bacterium]|jgi:biotin carboxyl carrier protein|nr:biotin/lipoyl-binding protein [Clostridia bacterium]
MRKFNVIVNGEAFEVEIEEVGGSAPAAPIKEPVSADTKPTPQPAAPPAPKSEAKPAVSKPVASGAANEVTSPLPGTVLSINCNEGQTVNAGDVVMILEAMKMENEIVAPQAGKITAIYVKKGDNVQAGDLLFALG